MMAHPRLQCLNSTRQVLKSSMRMRATFSTSSIARAEDDAPIREQTAAQLLASLDPPSPSTRPRNWNLPPVSENAQQPSAFTMPRTKINTRPTSGDSLRILNLIDRKRAQKNRPVQNTQSTGNLLEDVATNTLAHGLSKQVTRRWRAGDIYAPHDLSAVEMAKWKNRSKPDRDIFDVLHFNPLDHYKNFAIMGEYMTPMGRIEHRYNTGLRGVNQRKIAKAIRRSIGMGMMPSVHRHPEQLFKEMGRSRQGPLSRTRGPDM